MIDPSKAHHSSTLPKLRILVVDDADGIRSLLANALEIRGYDVDTVEDGKRALALLEGGAAPDAIILDMMLPGMDGLETLRRIREIDESVAVLMLSVVGTASAIVDAMKLGACDYLNKPFELDQVENALAQALEKKILQRQDSTREMLVPEHVGERVVWESTPMDEIHAVLHQVSETDVTMLIQGESGVGKEIVARTAHEISIRAEGPFVKVNCAALPEPLLESELFGYEKGAFTGAHARKPGKFEQANHGTIFLDEIGEMTPALQAKLLQVLQDSEFTRLGGNDVVSVDVRVLCATHRDIEAMVRAGTFREDLFFRLNVVPVSVPPLRERREQIPALARYFVQLFEGKYGRTASPMSEELCSALERYAFPGNVRELENMMKRLVVLNCEAQILKEMEASVPSNPLGAGRIAEVIEEMERTAGAIPLREVGKRVAREVERATIEHTLDRTEWNRKEAASLLGVSYKTLLQKIRACGVDPS
ncbi:sigma-54 dependent transcriptional regulator [Myxococcota bacterium]|nr:sigma-54 dependent transcriptional regulator [Myxococcota bacterium]